MLVGLAAQALGLELCRAYQRMAHHPQQGQAAKDQCAGPDDAAQPSKGFMLGLARRGAAVQRQVARRSRRQAALAAPVPALPVQLQQDLGSGEHAHLAVAHHVRLQHEWTGRAHAHAWFGNVRRHAGQVLRPAFMLAHIVHQGQAPQDDFVPDPARAFRALQAAAGDGVVAGQQDGRADEQRDQGEQRGAPPGSGQLHKPAQAAHACSTATAASRAMSQRQCRWAPSPAPRTCSRLPQNRRRSTASCR